ncbi:IclR family transcriptional regulator [Caulobacter sp. RHG1]|uniref:IclR family transcriptional regulator n=1 Tax=Caulobacter sp. (strain RHG1) TaxID=2545762 RepID=UPI0015518731|nr:IclR family transcriptional regulator [Caulobacter sp. RHG1]NQE63050.1 D-galactonate regulator, IclR family [Caulobacter sp. RHG1]
MASRSSTAAARRPEDAGPESTSQTLARAIDILDALREGPADLQALQARTGLTRSTTHRLANLLIHRRLVTGDGKIYRLGAGLIYLGFKSGERLELVDVARPVLAQLSAETDDAVNLGVRDGDEIIYLAQAPSRRRVVVRHQVGDRNQVAETALGRALLLDDGDMWRALFPREDYALNSDRGHVEHYDDGGDRIRCLAAPIREVSGGIVAALSLSSLPEYMDDARMAVLAERVREAAAEISLALGYEGPR